MPPWRATSAADVADPADVGVAVGLGEPEALGQVAADHVAVEQGQRAVGRLQQGVGDALGDRRLARAGQPGEEAGPRHDARRPGRCARSTSSTAPGTPSPGADQPVEPAAPPGDQVERPLPRRRRRHRARAAELVASSARQGGTGTGTTSEPLGSSGRLARSACTRPNGSGYAAGRARPARAPGRPAPAARAARIGSRSSVTQRLAGGHDHRGCVPEPVGDLRRGQPQAAGTAPCVSGRSAVTAPPASEPPSAAGRIGPQVRDVEQGDRHAFGVLQDGAPAGPDALRPARPGRPARPAAALRSRSARVANPATPGRPETASSTRSRAAPSTRIDGSPSTSRNAMSPGRCHVRNASASRRR